VSRKYNNPCPCSSEWSHPQQDCTMYCDKYYAYLLVKDYNGLEAKLREVEAREARLREAVLDVMENGLLTVDYDKTCRRCLRWLNISCPHDKKGCPIRRLEQVLQSPAPAEDLTSIGECDCEDCKVVESPTPERIIRDDTLKDTVGIWVEQKLFDSMQAVVEAAREYKTRCGCMECSPIVLHSRKICLDEDCPSKKLQKALETLDALGGGGE
jgi:hypothetical protein